LLVWLSAFGSCGFPRPPDIASDADNAVAVDAAGAIDGGGKDIQAGFRRPQGCSEVA
jgi:hypothetical protein